MPKGSITIDGISLTVAKWQNGIVDIAVIPYTYEHTNLRERVAGDAVNLEADVLGKYIESYLEAREKKTSTFTNIKTDYKEPLFSSRAES